MKNLGLKSAGAVLMLALAVRLLLLPLWPLFDPTEGRYAELARQMVQTGNWLTPHVWVNGFLIPFLGKPPLHFWLSAVSIECFGANEFAIRLASWLGALGTVAVVWGVGRRYFGAKAGALAAVVTLTSGLFFVLAGIVGVDMTLTAAVTLAYFSYFAWLQESQPRLRFLWSLGVFAGLGLGFLTKGPVALATYGMPIVVWHAIFGRWQDLKNHAWLTGGLLFLAIVVPWFWLAEKADPGFCRYFFVEENFHRFTSKDYYDPYGHGKVVPHGTSLLYMLVAALPWAFLLPGLFRRCRQRTWSWRRNPLWQTPAQAFFFLGVAVNVGFWGFATQYMITYMLPMVPMFAAWFVLLQQECWPEIEGFLLWLGRGVVAVTAVVFLAVAVVLQHRCLNSAKGVVAAVAASPVANLRLWPVHTLHTLYFYGDQAGLMDVEAVPGRVEIDTDGRHREFPYLKRGGYDGNRHGGLSGRIQPALDSSQEYLVVLNRRDFDDEKEFLGPHLPPRKKGVWEKLGLASPEVGRAGEPPSPPWDKLMLVRNPDVRAQAFRPWVFRPAAAGEQPDLLLVVQCPPWLLYRTRPKPIPEPRR